MYKNPRLKHVKKIKKIAEKRMYWYPETFNMINKIIDQCNLLLETKKGKCTCTFIGKIDGSKKRISRGCSKHDKFYKFRDGEDILDQLNKLSPKQKPFAQEVSEFVNGNNDKPFPQPEIEKVAENDGEWCTGGKVSITYGQREEMLREKLNEVIDRLNKLTKTK